MSKEKLSVKQWADEDKPREKMLTKGIKALSSAELIAIVIGSGTNEESAVDLGKRILNHVNRTYKAVQGHRSGQSNKHIGCFRTRI